MECIEEEEFSFENLPSDIVHQICIFLERRDISDLSRSSKRLFSFFFHNNSVSDNVWKHLTVKDFGIPYEDLIHYHFTPRHLYIALVRSKVSPTDILWPHMKGKRARRDPLCIEWAKSNNVKPFFVLHLFYKSQRRITEAKYTEDSESYFGKVLEICEMFRIQIEGQTIVRYPGLYKIVWRLKISDDYLDLGPLSFITRISKTGETSIPFDTYETLESNDDQHVYTWVVENQVQQNRQVIENRRRIEENLRAWNIEGNMMNNNNDQIVELNAQDQPEKKREFPLNKWFDVVVGKQIFESPNTLVFLSLINTSPAWKYGLWIDYVSIVPIHENEYKDLKFGPSYEEDLTNEMVLE